MAVDAKRFHDMLSESDPATATGAAPAAEHKPTT
jgi:hypothetical protein